MAASPAAASAVPSATYGQFDPPRTSGRTRPTPNPAAIPARPVRHHARYVRSCKRRIRWTSALAISGIALDGTDGGASGLVPARGGPDVDRAVDGVAVDLGKLGVR